jgi:hypothetical protein
MGAPGGDRAVAGILIALACPLESTRAEAVGRGFDRNLWVLHYGYDVEN